MPILKTKWRRSIAVLLCVMLMFCAAFSLTAYADSAVITTAPMYSYFQTYNTSGTWVDLQTPGHATSDGQVAYCLQTSKDNPYNAAYSSIDGEYVYDKYVLTGLKAILTHGYPTDNGGFSDLEARYATANAIRFFLAENYADGMPQYLNLNVNGDWIRSRPGYEDLFYWSLSLLQMARSGNVSTGGAGSLTFSPSEITLTQEGDYFTGSVTLTNGINGTYDLMDDMPEGKQILGHTGADQETLTIKIPVAYANGSYTLCAYGMDHLPTAKLFFWAPSVYNQQRIVTSTLDGSQDVFVRGFLTVKTPSATVQPQKGSLQITKTDDNGNPLSGVGFTLYDASKRAISTKTTDTSGIATFSDLDLGNYYYAETSALPGYVLDSTQYPVSISSNGQVVKKTMTNTPEKGGLQITKTDDSGNPLSGVGFTLYDASKRTISTKTTDSSGVVSFSDLAPGNYYYAETSALPGYVPDTTQYAVSITTSSLLVQKTVTNERIPAKGSLKLVKTDENGTPIASTGFQLLDSNGNRITSGGTDSSGVLVFSDLPLGNYYYQETFAVPGYALDDTKYPVSITENGQTITKTVINYKSAGTIKILKTDSETGQPLQGAEFTILDDHMREVTKGTTDESGVVVFAGLPLGPYYCQETQAPPGYVPLGSIELVYLDGNGKVVTLTYTNKPARGSIKLTKKNSDGELLSGVVFTLYDADKNELTTGTTDENGVVVFDNLPIGDYWYAETSELPGYVANHNLMAARVGFHTAVDEHTFTNYKAHGHVRVIKSDENGAPLAGVHFKLTDEAGNLIDEGDTGTDGKLIFSMLPVGKYILKETATLTGYVLDETPISIELVNDGDVVIKEITNSQQTGGIAILKTDADTSSPLAGAHFKLTDSSGRLIKEGDTAADGKLTFTGLPLGTYKLTETAAPAGYVLDSTPITVEVTNAGQTVSKTINNAKQTGSIAILKTVADTGNPLAGAHFKLTDSTGKLIKEGDTAADGKLIFTGLALGTYKLTETAAPAGYVLDSTPITVEVTNAGQTVSKTITNTRAVGNISILKTDAETSKPLAGVHFKLTDSTGKLISEAVTGTEGKITFSGMSLGAYTLTETEAPKGYALDSAPIPVELTEHGKTVEISVKNIPSRGNLKLIKKDAYENKPLAGAVYQLMDESGRKLAEGIANENGEIVFENLLYGNYRVQEISAPKGYKVDERAYTVTVPTENGTQTVTDLRRPGTLEVKKQDEKGKPLAGASFLLEYSTNNGTTWTPVTNRSGENITTGGCTSAALNAGQLTTDSTGSVSFTGLRADSTILYRLTETKAPAGYSLIGTELYNGTLPIETQKTNIEDSETVDGKTYCYSLYVTATDDPTYRLPETGGRGFDLLPLFMPICAIPLIIYLKRKEDCQS